MSLLRDDSKKRLNKVIKKFGSKGDIGDQTVKHGKKHEKDMPNSLWIDNVKNRKIDTMEKNMKLKVEKFSDVEQIKNVTLEENKKKVEFIKENFNKTVNKKVRLIIRELESNKVLSEKEVNECFADVKDALDVISKKSSVLLNEIYNDAKPVEVVKENTANDDILTAIRNNNTIKNWTTFNNVQNRTERPVHAGQYVEVGDVKGYINRIDGDKVYIDSIAPKDSTIKDTEIVVKLKDVVKAYKPEKPKNEVVVDLSTQGPSQKSVAKEPEVSKSKETGIEPDDKSKKAADNKITAKINKEDDFKLKSAADYGDTIIEKTIIKFSDYKK